MGNREVVGDLQEKQTKVGKTKNKIGTWENKKGTVNWITNFSSVGMGRSLMWWVFFGDGESRIVLAVLRWNIDMRIVEPIGGF